jgi:hypothetical protein
LRYPQIDQAPIGQLPMLGPTTRVSRHLAPLDAGQQQRHKLRNLVQSVILLGGMVGLLALCG